jgi:hypothetical protein
MTFLHHEIATTDSIFPPRRRAQKSPLPAGGKIAAAAKFAALLPARKC